MPGAFHVTSFKHRATTQMRNSVGALKIAQDHTTGEQHAGSQTNAQMKTSLAQPTTAHFPHIRALVG